MRAFGKTGASYIHESQFSWDLMRQIVDQCHLYDPEVAYQPFESLNRR